MDTIWNALKSEVAAIGIILTILTALWTSLRALAKRRFELRLERLRIYHQLIKGLVPPDETGKTWQDCHVGFVFELRNIPEYFETSLKILRGLRKTWGETKGVEERLLSEMDAAIAEIDRKSKTKRHHIKQWFRNFSTS